jgi:riboflavin kinase
VTGSRDILVKGVVFSDLGRAGAFLGLGWVRDAIRERVGFDPYPGTLNVRAQGADLIRWEQVRRHGGKIVLPSPDPAFCNAFLFTGSLEGWESQSESRERIAVVVPEVKEYPADKLEIIAAVSLKQTRSVRDGDALTVVFEAEPVQGP